MKSDYINVKSTPKQLQKARRFIEDFFKQRGCSESVIQDVNLAAGEALANAVEHSGKGKTTIRVTCTLGLSHMVVEIQDNGIFKQRMDGLNGGRGYGMHIMQELMDEVEVHQSQVGTKVTLVKVCRVI